MEKPGKAIVYSLSPYVFPVLRQTPEQFHKDIKLLGEDIVNYAHDNGVPIIFVDRRKMFKDKQLLMTVNMYEYDNKTGLALEQVKWDEILKAFRDANKRKFADYKTSFIELTSERASKFFPWQTAYATTMALAVVITYKRRHVHGKKEVYEKEGVHEKEVDEKDLKDAKLYLKENNRYKLFIDAIKAAIQNKLEESTSKWPAKWKLEVPEKILKGAEAAEKAYRERQRLEREAASKLEGEREKALEIERAKKELEHERFLELELDKKEREIALELQVERENILRKERERIENERALELQQQQQQQQQQQFPSPGEVEEEEEESSRDVEPFVCPTATPPQLQQQQVIPVRNPSELENTMYEDDNAAYTLGEIAIADAALVKAGPMVLNDRDVGYWKRGKHEDLMAFMRHAIREEIVQSKNAKLAGKVAQLIAVNRLFKGETLEQAVSSVMNGTMHVVQHIVMEQLGSVGTFSSITRFLHLSQLERNLRDSAQVSSNKYKNTTMTVGQRKDARTKILGCTALRALLPWYQKYMGSSVAAGGILPKSEHLTEVTAMVREYTRMLADKRKCGSPDTPMIGEPTVSQEEIRIHEIAMETFIREREANSQREGVSPPSVLMLRPISLTWKALANTKTANDRKRKFEEEEAEAKKKQKKKEKKEKKKKEKEHKHKKSSHHKRKHDKKGKSSSSSSSSSTTTTTSGSDSGSKEKEQEQATKIPLKRTRTGFDKAIPLLVISENMEIQDHKAIQKLKFVISQGVGTPVLQAALRMVYTEVVHEISMIKVSVSGAATTTTTTTAAAATTTPGVEGRLKILDRILDVILQLEAWCSEQPDRDKTHSLADRPGEEEEKRMKELTKIYEEAMIGENSSDDSSVGCSHCHGSHLHRHHHHHHHHNRCGNMTRPAASTCSFQTTAGTGVECKKRMNKCSSCGVENCTFKCDRCKLRVCGDRCFSRHQCKL